MEAHLIDWKSHFAEVDPKDGYTKVYNMHTGEVIAVEDPKSKEFKTPEEFDIRPAVKFTPLTAQLVCAKIAGGAIVKNLCEDEPWMPSYAVFCRWTREHPEFKEMLVQAEKDRAELIADETVEIARALYNKEGKRQVDVMSATLLVEQLWRKAGVDNARLRPETSKTGVSTTQVAVQVFIETGIRREGDPGFNIDETEKLKARVLGTTQILAPSEERSIGNQQVIDMQPVGQTIDKIPSEGT